jgi:hypothetical protein
VITIHPDQVCAMRPGFSATGGKSDSFDSFGLAELTKAPRALREDRVQTRAGLENELRASSSASGPAP